MSNIVVETAERNSDVFIYLTIDNEIYTIPIMPKKLTVKDTSKNTTMDILTIGQIVVPQRPGLKEISWSSWFPYDNWYPYIKSENTMKPAKWVSLLEEVRDKRKPIWITITGIGINTKAVIKSFNWYHQGGDTEDKYYDITFTEYKDFSILVQNNAIVKDSNSETKAVVTTTETALPTEPCIGAKVKVNGRLYADSYGGGAGATCQDYYGTISLINKEGTKMYHIQDLSGGSLGWVDKESIELCTTAEEQAATNQTGSLLNTGYSGKTIVGTGVTQNKAYTSYYNYNNTPKSTSEKIAEKIGKERELNNPYFTCVLTAPKSSKALQAYEEEGRVE